MRYPNSISRYVFMICGAVLICGCDSAPVAMPEGKKYLLAEEPTGAQSITDAKQDMSAQDEQDSTDMVVIGRIGLADYDTWDPARAAFLIRDESVVVSDDHGVEGHNADNCPFCKRRKKKALEESTARVELVDEQGNVPSIGANKLLGLLDDQLVVVRGRGKIDELGTLVVLANGIFVRDPAKPSE